jgi:hypothetical protein
MHPGKLRGVAGAKERRGVHAGQVCWVVLRTGGTVHVCMHALAHARMWHQYLWQRCMAVEVPAPALTPQQQVLQQQWPTCCTSRMILATICQQHMLEALHRVPSMAAHWCNGGSSLPATLPHLGGRPYLHWRFLNTLHLQACIA